MLTTLADDRPSEDEVCGQSLSIGSKVCKAQILEGSERCLVHHPERRIHIRQLLLAENPTLEFSETEVDQDLLAELLELNVMRISNSPDLAVPINFSGSLITANFNGVFFSDKADFHQATFSRAANFRGSRFPKGADFRQTSFLATADFGGAEFLGITEFLNATFAHRVSFRCSVFQSKTDFRYTEFEDHAIFNGIVSNKIFILEDAVFNGITEFQEATFRGGFRLKQTRFLQGITFRSASFPSEATFERILFGSDVDFGDVTFPGSACFSSVTFTLGVTFHDITFSDEIKFRDAEFRNGVSFNAVTFSNAAIFENVQFSGCFSFSNVRFSNVVNFGGVTRGTLIRVDNCVLPLSSLIIVGQVPVRLNQLVVSEPLIIDSRVASDMHQIASISITQSTLMCPVTITANTKLTESSFEGSTGLDQLRFQGDPEWPTARWGRKAIFDELSHSELRAAPEQLEILYRQLRAGLEASKGAAAAADFFYGEMEARRVHIRRSGKSRCFGRLRTGRNGSAQWWLLSLYKWFAGYGVRPSRAFTWYFATVVAIGALFWGFNAQLVDSSVAGAPSVSSLLECVAFALRNSISLFRAADIGLEPFGVMLLVLGRFAGVGFLALAVVGLRSHTER